MSAAPGAGRPETRKPDALARVRQFNRTVTERIGALNDRFLSRDRPLGEARVLWEIGAEGRRVRSLRERLDLDSGYLSRLLRSLESDGMVGIEPDPLDGRVRVARLTEAGLEERALLDRLSDELAWSFLAPLNASQRTRLVEALELAERLLTAGLVEVEAADPESEEAQQCVGAYFDELDRRFDVGFDPAESIAAPPEELRLPHGLLLIARLRGDAMGCGALRLPEDRPAEIKRMWVDPAARGLGLGRRLLQELEDRARHHHASTVRLETNRSLTEAIHLYRSAGYAEVEPFNDETYAHHWFEKRLDQEEEHPPTPAAPPPTPSSR